MSTDEMLLVGIVIDENCFGGIFVGGNVALHKCMHFYIARILAIQSTNVLILYEHDCV